MEEREDRERGEGDKEEGEMIEEVRICNVVVSKKLSTQSLSASQGVEVCPRVVLAHHAVALGVDWGEIKFVVVGFQVQHPSWCVQQGCAKSTRDNKKRTRGEGMRRREGRRRREGEEEGGKGGGGEKRRAGGEDTLRFYLGKRSQNNPRQELSTRQCLMSILLPSGT